MGLWLQAGCLVFLAALVLPSEPRSVRSPAPQIDLPAHMHVPAPTLLFLVLEPSILPLISLSWAGDLGSPGSFKCF